ncbi:D-2-hydroxyacid dehydrogenase [Mesorhizobium sp. YR577]|uniref:D-2-hydroxyacid dehydrogenase n=1 Tax=Mesorhizobium sp. YR577 TaxID=1884373 RepID=UPI0008F00FF9|nr:D-2-hydroxyacid dehydrogenase [Mesorhizobium sp. YR577]SFU21876.1 Phosphoglycerate dehydrogenase [Mesorhizobium sp. YR577]
MNPTPSSRRILVVGAFAEEQLALIKQAAPEWEVGQVASISDPSEDLANVEVVAGPLPAELLSRAQSLRWVHSWAAGPDTQLYTEFVIHSATLTCSKGNGAIPLAEHAMMLMLLLNRNAMRWIDAQRERRWDPFMHGELNGKTVGIIGTGHSGTDLARKARAFHMKVLGLRRTRAEAPEFDRVYSREALHEFLGECDFVVVTTPFTPDTENMLGEAEFRAMKDTAFYICFSRGGIANDEALLRALKEQWIAGAGLDAHGQEPLSKDSPFWDVPNTIITPHNGATTAATKARGFEIFIDNLHRYHRGERLMNVVDKQAGY